MQAFVLAAGLGTRLRPLTDRIPKALVPVAGAPLLDRTLRRLVASGAREAVVNVHHHGDRIIDYVRNHDWGIPVEISDERSALLDTGGGLRKAIPLFSDPESPILIHNVDILSDAPLSLFYRESRACDVLLMVSARETQRYLLFDDDMRLVGWTNVKTGEVRSPYVDLDLAACRKYAFSGIHSVNPALLSLMENYPEAFPIMQFYLDQCARIDIHGHVVPELRMLDVGKIDSLAAADSFVERLPE